MKLRSKFFVSIAPVLLGILLGGLLVGFIRKNDNEMYLKIHQGIDVFGKVFKEVSFNYVDEIDPAKFLDAGVDGMLKTLDPYTTYLGEKDEEEMELITTGKYAGVGITITLRDGRVYVTAIMERYSAAREGIQVGDEIVEIEGKAIAGMSLRDVQRLVRGNAGTSFKMKVDREVEGKSEKHEFILTREEIAVRNITAAEFIENGIAYIRLDRFTRTASNDLRKTINDLNAKGEVEGLIFDIRDNPGGLLDIAVDVTSKFVPESSLVVSTRGRKSEQETKFYSREQPMLTDIPLILLVNRQSASASEIVAGTIQDRDRGIVVGERTFGKGLVQTLTRITDNTSLKITTARYYTPSGRCIQEIDYLHKDKDGVFLKKPDSLRKEFHTLNGRKVFEAGGITPDTIIKEKEPTDAFSAIFRKGMFYKFTNRFYESRKTIPENFEVTDSTLKAFEKFLKDNKFDYQENAELRLKDLRLAMESAKFKKSFTEDIDRISSAVQTEKARMIERNKEEIRRALKGEIVLRYFGESARIKAMFPYDIQLQTALSIIKNEKQYKKMLGMK